MALTDTTASKKFIAGAPDIILKGDYRRKKPDMKMASAPDIDDSRNELALELFGKELGNSLTVFRTKCVTDLSTPSMERTFFDKSSKSSLFDAFAIIIESKSPVTSYTA